MTPVPPATRDARTADPVRLALGRPLRRGVLVGHVIVAGTWLGVDVAFVALVVTAVLTDDPYTAGLCLSVLPLLIGPLLVAGLLTLLTGLVLGMGTRYGLLRHWWVVAKLAITVLYLVLIPVGLIPTVVDRARLGEALLDRLTTTVDIGDLAYPAVAGPMLLITATVLAVLKPRGRVRRLAAARDDTNDVGRRRSSQDSSGESDQAS